MSLDVYLKVRKWVSYNKELTDLTEEEETVYDANITHNLNTMADKAGIYEALWRPHRLKEDYNANDNYDAEYEFENKVITVAKEIIPILERGLKDLKKRPKYFEKFNSENGWGTYEHFVPFVENYLIACKDFPNAIVKVSR